MDLGPSFSRRQSCLRHPARHRAMALLYNKRLFDQYGLTVPTTWDEFTQQTEKLAQASSGKVKMANFFPTHAPWFISMAWASGAQLFKAQGDAWVLNAQRSGV